jgi:RNA polymerase sigma-70 factor (ECF subfamily)
VNVSEVAAPDAVEQFWRDDYARHLTKRALELMQRDFAEKTWKACWACVVEGKPATVVAAELGMTVGAVYVAKSRVLSRLRVELEGMLD